MNLPGSSSSKAALVTGSAKRVGRAFALALASDGYEIICHVNHSQNEAQSLIEEISQGGGKAHLLQGDLRDIAMLTGSENLIHQAEKLCEGPLTLLVNNASLFLDDRVTGTLTETSFAAQMEVNLRAPVFLAQAFSDNLRRIDEQMEGLIVNMIDHRVLKLTPQFFSYSLSKAALYTATQIMARALAPQIRVAGIGPGPTLQNIHQSDADWQHEQSQTLLGRGSPVEDMVHALRFIMHNRSVTGQMIAIDAGQHLNWQTADVIGGGGGHDG